LALRPQFADLLVHHLRIVCWY